MGPTIYTTVSRRHHRTRGFRVNPQRFCVQRLRTKLFNFFKILVRSWKSCSSSLSFTKNRSKRCSKVRDCSSPRSSVAGNVDQSYVCRLRSLGRSNSFYAEAIADCLEFIKNSSVSLDDKSGSFGTGKSNRASYIMPSSSFLTTQPNPHHTAISSPEPEPEPEPESFLDSSSNWNCGFEGNTKIVEAATVG
ncbi:hypothetical protein LXL04_019424 [Taraxacum kok-saghyz]